MRPASGRINPKHRFRIVLLPEPATPRTTLVSPRLSSNDTPSRTTRSSKASFTSSKMMVLWTVSTGLSSGSCMRHSSQRQQELGQDNVHEQNEDRGGHY